jgi:hypothetical protein
LWVKNMPILTDPMKKYLLNDGKKGYTAETRSAYNRRIIDYAIRGISDLSFLAEKLPEDVQAQVFNERTLGSLVRSLFRLIVKEHAEVADFSEMDKEELEKRRKRVLGLCYEALNEIGDVFNARNLAPDVMGILLEAGPSETLPAITALKAVYIKGLSLRE